LEDGGQVFEREARGDGIDAYAELVDVWWAGLGEEVQDVLPCGRLLGGCDGVFEIVGDGVYCETSGLLQEPGRGGWYCIRLVGVAYQHGEGR
jgi:hypothetical protein